MAFIKVTSPHAHAATKTSRVMQTVLLATLPGIVALTLFFGVGVILNLILAIAFCLGFEALVLKIRHRDIAFYLGDYSAVVTAVLLALAIPAYAPWWLLAVGCFFAIVISKQLYGGLGNNPFNPAMIAYVVLLISFPLEMTRWGASSTMLAEGQSLPNVMETLQLVFGFAPTELIDGYTAATPLDVIKQNTSLTLSAIYNETPLFTQGYIAGAGWEWVNIGFLLGGIFLLYKKIFTWHAPIAMLSTLAILATLFYDGGSSASSGSPIFHLLCGGTMLGAFFIVTDPVTSAVSNRGRVVYGCGIGLLIFVIRAWGNYPDAVAFSVLLMNFAAPFIDYYTKPRTYGHAKSK